MYHLVLIRHGVSEWNELNLFTGWYDCGLTESGRAEARAAGPMLCEAGLIPDVVHTSLLQRAIETAELVLAGCDRRWVPVRRHWRLNERHYGDLTGLDKTQTRKRHGDEQLQQWRRGYYTAPPPIRDDNPYNPNTAPAYANLPPELLPRSECLADVVARLLPYWYDSIVADLRAGRTVMVTAHGNSLRALVKHLDEIDNDQIVSLNIPTGMPLYYRLDSDMVPAERLDPLERALDPEAALAGAAAVAAQAS